MSADALLECLPDFAWSGLAVFWPRHGCEVGVAVECKVLAAVPVAACPFHLEEGDGALVRPEAVAHAVSTSVFGEALEDFELGVRPFFVQLDA